MRSNIIKSFKQFILENNTPEFSHEPDLYVVEIDETYQWSDEIKNKLVEGAKIYGVYLLDKSKITHLADLAGSYYLYHLYNSVSDTEGLTEDDIAEIELLNTDSDNMYVHENTKFEQEVKVQAAGTYIDVSEITDEQTYNEFMEQQVDYFKSNHVI